MLLVFISPHTSCTSPLRFNLSTTQTRHIPLQFLGDLIYTSVFVSRSEKELTFNSAPIVLQPRNRWQKEPWTKHYVKRNTQCKDVKFVYKTPYFFISVFWVFKRRHQQQQIKLTWVVQNKLSYTPTNWWDYGYPYFVHIILI